MGQFNTRNGLNSLANSDILGQLAVTGGGASIPLLVDGATNRLLTLSDTNSGSVFLIQDADGDQLIDVKSTGLFLGAEATGFLLPSSVSSSQDGYFLKVSHGSQQAYWANPFSTLELADITKLDLSPTSTDQLPGSVFTYTDASASIDYSFDGPRAGFLAVRQLGSSVTAGAPLARTGSGYVGNIAEIGVKMCNNNDRCLGIAFSDELSNRFVAITSGLIPNLDTSAWSSGDILYVSNTTGELTNTVPTSGIYVQRVGYVVSSNATTGIIAVNVDPAFDEDQSSYITDVTGDVIGDLSNVNVSGASAGNLLRYDGTNWVDTTLTIPSSAAVTAGTTEVLKFTTSHTGTIAELDLGELGDVDLTTTSPTTNDVLKFDGTNWVPGTLSSSTAMEDISNTSITPADLKPGNFLLYSATGSGGVWYPANYTLPTSDGSDWQVLTARDIGNTYNDAEWQTLTLTRLGDVNTTGVADGDTLVYNSTSGNFEPGTAGGSQTLDETLTEGNTSTQDATFGGVTVSQSDTGSAFIAANSLDTGADWSALSITSTSSSPATNDYLGSISWFGQNDAAENVNYARIDVQTPDVGDGVEDGTMNIHLMNGGTLDEVLEIRGSGITARKNLTVVGSVSAQTASGTSNLFEAVSGDGSGADWPAFAVSRYTTSPANNDNVGIFQFNHMNSAISLKTFADIEVVATDVSATAEDGKMIFNILEDGTSTAKLQLVPSGALVDGTVQADTFSLSTTDDTGQYVATRAVNVPTDWNAFEAFRYDVTYATGPIGSQAFSALNDNDETIRYARATGVIADSTDGSEDGEWRWYTMVGGTDTKLMQLDGDGLQLGGASGFVLPLTDGTSNQVLQTDGSGNVSWATAGGSVSDLDDLGDVFISSPSGNQVLIYDQVQTRWENGSIPVPTLAEVTAAGASTSTTLSVAQVLQTGTHINVAASGNFSTQLRAKTLEVGASTGSLSYTFPASDGNDGEVLTTDGAGTLTWEAPHYRTWQVFGNHQLTTSNETNYRFMGHTSYGQNYGLFNLNASTLTGFPLVFAQYVEKTGHLINDAGDYAITLDISASVSSGTTNSGNATEYLGDTYTFELYVASRTSNSNNATFTLIDDVDVVFNSTDSRRPVSGKITTTYTLAADEFLVVLGKGTTSQGVTRYLQTNYNLSLYKQP